MNLLGRLHILFPVMAIMLLSVCHVLPGQNTNSNTGGNRLSVPVEMDVRVSGDKVIFNAVNKSYLPYGFEISFHEFQNLAPKIGSKKTTLYPGRNSLFTLTVQNRSKPSNYNFSYKCIAGLDREPDLLYPYLVPVGPDKIVQYDYITDNGKKLIIVNKFRVSEGDTIYSVRKGYVSALPDNKTEVDRFAFSSLEVCHSDGTIAVYEGLVPIDTSLILGRVVYPGEPVGIAGNKGIVRLRIFGPDEANSFTSINVFYTKADGKLMPARSFNGFSGAYPDSLIVKELSTEEIRKFENRILYGQKAGLIPGSSPFSVAVQ